MRSHNSGNRVNICIFERWNEKTHFSKTKIYFHKKTTPKLLGHIGLQCMKVGEKTNLPLFVWCMLALALNIFSFEQILSLKKSKKKKKNQTKQNKQKNIGPLNGKREKIYQPGIVRGHNFTWGIKGFLRDGNPCKTQQFIT